MTYGTEGVVMLPFEIYSRHDKMCEWFEIFNLKAYDLRYSLQMSLMYDWGGDIGGLAKGKEGHN